jgi:integrase
MMSVQSGSIASFPRTLSSYSKFRMALKSKEVQRQYPNLLEKFLDFCRFEGLDIEEKSQEFFRFAKDKSQDEVEDIIIRFVSFQTERIHRQEITAGTLRNYVKAIKLFCRMNRINISWDIIVRSLPKVKQYSNDRVPTVDEMKKLIQYPDRRIKLIILLSVSTGIRVGAWDFMKWKNIKPIEDENGNTLAAKLIVYPDEPEQYFTFMTPEAYSAVKEWMDFRASFGEEISGESWVLRNTWQKVKPRYSHRIGLAKYPRQFKSTGIKTLVGRALQIQGIRPKITQMVGKKNHEWKTLHGFRKFFKTQAERTMKSLIVEILMGHDIGLADSYYRPSEQELLKEYLSAVDLLTIHDDKTKLEKQITELRENSTDKEYIIEGRLREKDEQIQALTKRQEKFEQLVQSLIDSGQFKP